MGIDLSQLETLRPEQIQDIQFDTGILVRNFNIDDFRESILNGTVSQVTKDSFGVNVQRDLTNVLSELNNVHFDYLEGLVTTKITTTATFTLASMSADDLALALGSADIEGDLITVRFAIETGDFKNIALILPILDGGFVIAEIPFAYSTGGLSISTSKAAVGGLNCTVTGYKSLANKQIQPINLYRIAGPVRTLSTITVTSAQGTASGTTKLTLTGYTPAASESYVYKTGTNAPTIAFGEVPDYTWSAWNGSADISAASGSKITVVSIDSTGKAVAAGTATVTAKA